METIKRVAFLGLGVMGYPMAGHLATAGHAVTVYNRTAAKAGAWAKQHGGTVAATPREAAAGAEIVFACVGNDDDVRQVVLADDGAFAGMAKGALFVDHTTASADLARELDTTATGRGLRFLDAPVSGGQAGAENGALTVMVGGDTAVFAEARPVIDAYARACELMGPAGSGQLAKMVNQICIAGILQGLAGLDMAKVFDVISKGAAQSWQMENRGTTMIAGEYEFGFAVDWMRKDLAICLAEGNRNGARMPMTAQVDQFYKHVQARGGGRWDTSALLHLLVND